MKDEAKSVSGLSPHDWESTPFLTLILLMRARDAYIVDQPSMASLDLQAQTESSLNMDYMIAGDDTIWGHIVGQEEGGWSTTWAF